jgi:hypothetical protein
MLHEQQKMISTRRNVPEFTRLAATEPRDQEGNDFECHKQIWESQLYGEEGKQRLISFLYETLIIYLGWTTWGGGT